ncbi:MAG: hypothetical protein ACE5MK_05125 [Acidobacteriota bacterium]
MKKRMAVLAVFFEDSDLRALSGLTMAGPALAAQYLACNGAVGTSGDTSVQVMTQVDKPSVADLLLITEDSQVLRADGQPIGFMQPREGDYVGMSAWLDRMESSMVAR